MVIRLSVAVGAQMHLFFRVLRNYWFSNKSYQSLHNLNIVVKLCRTYTADAFFALRTFVEPKIEPRLCFFVVRWDPLAQIGSDHHCCCRRSCFARVVCGDIKLVAAAVFFSEFSSILLLNYYYWFVTHTKKCMHYVFGLPVFVNPTPNLNSSYLLFPELWSQSLLNAPLHGDQFAGDFFVGWTKLFCYIILSMRTLDGLRNICLGVQ